MNDGEVGIHEVFMSRIPSSVSELRRDQLHTVFRDPAPSNRGFQARGRLRQLVVLSLLLLIIRSVTIQLGAAASGAMVAKV